MRFVTTVEPCRTTPIAPTGRPSVSAAMRIPRSTPTDWSSGVDSTFSSVSAPVSSSSTSTSVNVPPTSTPKR
jgi:hypothetical protein